MKEICKNCKKWHVAESRCVVKGWPTRSDHVCDEKSSFDPVEGSCKSSCKDCKCDKPKDVSSCNGAACDSCDSSCNSNKSDVDIALDEWWNGITSYVTDHFIEVDYSNK